MERFKYYGELEKIISGNGKLYLDNDINYKVSFEIAKRGEEKLLFNAICKELNPFDSFNLFQYSGKIKLVGKDELGRNVNASKLLIKDTDANTERGTVINGYVDQCEIGVKQFSQECEAQFHLINFLFDENVKKNEHTEISFKTIWPFLQLSFYDFQCKIEKIENFEITKKLLKRQGGVLKTSLLKVEVSKHEEYEAVLEKVRKLCQLLSVARSTFINWGTCQIINAKGEAIYEFHGHAQTKPFHGNALINELPKETESFLLSAWVAYEENKEVFDLSRFLYGYADTYMNSYIETRCLNIAALTESICSRWAIKEGRDRFIDKKEFEKYLPKLKKDIKVTLQKTFQGIKESHTHVILSKINGFNRRPLNWKLKRLRKEFHCPITDNEIKRFVYLRDSLAHSSLFPEDEDNIDAFLFMRHFLDRIVLCVLGYSGIYFDMENRVNKALISN